MNQELEAKTIAAGMRLHPMALLLAVADAGVQPKDFSDATHRTIWEAILAIALAGKRPTELEVLEATKGLKVPTVRQVLNANPELPLAGLAQRLREEGKRRRALMGLERCVATLKGPGNAQDAYTGLTGALKAISEETVGVKTSEGTVAQVVNDMEETATGKRQPVIATGLERWDVTLGGLQPTLTVIGAQPGVGKSALLAGIVRNIAQSGVKVGFFSLEDEKKWVASRLLSYFSRVPLQTLLFRRLSKEEQTDVHAALGQVYDVMSRVVIDDRQGLDCRDVVMAADAMVASGCKVIFVDHLGEIRIKSKERHDLEITEVCSDLRAIAKRHGVPVVLACHTKRNGNETAADKPRLTDFAFSSGIERTCRVGLGLSKVIEDGQTLPTPGLMRVHVLKQTNGASDGAFDLNIDQRSAVVTADAKASEGFKEKVLKNYPSASAIL